jgi:glycosyltransferase involved in cell wall biosynthesis
VRIGFDLTALLPEQTGVDRYCLGLVRCLAETDRHNEYVLFLNREDRKQLKGAIPQGIRMEFVCRRPRLFRLLFQQFALPLYGWMLNLDIIHSPAFLIPLIRGSSHHLVSVHDMTFFSQERCHTWLHRSFFYRTAVIASIRRARQVLVPSAWVKNEVLRLVPDLVDEAKVRVIPYGVQPLFHPRSPVEIRAVLDRYGLNFPYILSVCTLEPRKNLLCLVRSYRELICERGIPEHLVLAGRFGWELDQLMQETETLRQVGKIHLLGYVPDEDLPSIYGGASVFVYPSIEEGFGFPPLEAMASGIPTVASDNSSLAENLRGAAELVPADDSAALKDAIYLLCSDQRRRTELVHSGLARAARFSWADTAARTIECYAEACSECLWTGEPRAGAPGGATDEASGRGSSGLARSNSTGSTNR